MKKKNGRAPLCLKMDGEGAGVLKIDGGGAEAVPYMGDGRNKKMGRRFPPDEKARGTFSINTPYRSHTQHTPITYTPHTYIV